MLVCIDRQSKPPLMLDLVDLINKDVVACYFLGVSFMLTVNLVLAAGLNPIPKLAAGALVWPMQFWGHVSQISPTPPLKLPT